MGKEALIWHFNATRINLKTYTHINYITCIYAYVLIPSEVVYFL